MMEATEQGPGAGLPVMERRRWLINIICSSVFVAIIFVALRLFSRRLMRQKIWWDDYFIVFAMVRTHYPPHKLRRGKMDMES